MYSWGCNDEGALGRHATQKDGDEWLAKEVDLPSGMHVTMISAGDSHSTALTTLGTVYAWGTYRVSRLIDSYVWIGRVYTALNNLCLCFLIGYERTSWPSSRWPKICACRNS